MSSTVFGFVQGASLCFCSTKTLPAVAGTNLPFAPDGRKRRRHSKAIMEETNEIRKRHKGGRPLKKIKRCNDIRVRLTDTERFLIEEKAKEAGMLPSAWFRQAAKRAKVVSRLTPEDLRILRMLAGMANNLNQITHLAHKEGLLSVQKRCREILTEIDETLKYLNSDDRKS